MMYIRVRHWAYHTPYLTKPDQPHVVQMLAHLPDITYFGPDGQAKDITRGVMLSRPDPSSSGRTRYFLITETEMDQLVQAWQLSKAMKEPPETTEKP